MFHNYILTNYTTTIYDSFKKHPYLKIGAKNISAIFFILGSSDLGALHIKLNRDDKLISKGRKNIQTFEHFYMYVMYKYLFYLLYGNIFRIFFYLNAGTKMVLIFFFVLGLGTLARGFL